MIKKQDFEKYTKDEIVEVIVKCKMTFNAEKLLNKLKRRVEKKLLDNYVKISQQYENKRKEFYNYLIMLESKYGKVTFYGGVPSKNITKEEFDKWKILIKGLQALEFKKDIAYGRYELDCRMNKE